MLTSSQDAEQQQVSPAHCKPFERATPAKVPLLLGPTLGLYNLPQSIRVFLLPTETVSALPVFSAEL